MEEKLNVKESELFALTSILLPREMLFYEPEFLLNGWKFNVRINILVKGALKGNFGVKSKEFRFSPKNQSSKSILRQTFATKFFIEWQSH